MRQRTDPAVVSLTIVTLAALATLGYVIRAMAAMARVRVAPLVPPMTKRGDNKPGRSDNFGSVLDDGGN